MGHQKGDQQITLKGKAYTLRLTMGALADLNSRLCVKGPQDLSLRLRSLNAAQGRVLLACVMRPCLPRGAANAMPAATLSDAELSAVMPAVCKLFEEAFRDDR